MWLLHRMLFVWFLAWKGAKYIGLHKLSTTCAACAVDY